MGYDIDPKKITEEVKTGNAVLVDVREDDEWFSGHAKPAIHLSVNRIMQGDVPTKDTDKKVYVYCASGGRSSMAANMLQGQGYDAENIGGLTHWRSAGGEIE